jgi:uncharacterized membrane protein
MAAVTFEEAVEWVGKGVDGVGVVIVVVGSLAALLPYLFAVAARRADEERYARTRRRVGRAILLGLEFLVAGDIIRTVAATPTFTSVGVLAAIVAIRTFLSMALQVEVDGRWPWQRAREPAATERRV